MAHNPTAYLAFLINKVITHAHNKKFQTFKKDVKDELGKVEQTLDSL